MIVSPSSSPPSSDKSVMVWSLTRGDIEFGVAKKALRGHSHFVQDVVLSSDGNFCLSASWGEHPRHRSRPMCPCAKSKNSTHSFYLFGRRRTMLRNDSQHLTDRSLRLWDLKNGKTIRRFVGHDKDVLSVAFSADNRQIVSGSRDKSIKIWNILGECKYTIKENGHNDWVSCVRVSPNPQNPVIVSAGWDKVIKACSDLRRVRGKGKATKS